MKCIHNAKTGKYETPKYDMLMQKLRYTTKHAEEELLEDRGSLVDTAKMKPWQMGDRVSSYAQSWMRASATLYWVAIAADALYHFTRENLDNIGFGVYFEAEELDNPLLLDALEDAAEKAVVELTTQVLRKLLGGVDSSSNPMTVVHSMAQHDAAQKALERLCGIESWSGIGNLARDIHEGKARREAEQSAKRAMLVDKIVVLKRAAAGGGEYIAQAFNDDGDQLAFIELNTTRKGEAKIAAQTWADELTAKGKNHGRIHVEV